MTIASITVPAIPSGWKPTAQFTLGVAGGIWAVSSTLSLSILKTYMIVGQLQPATAVIQDVALYINNDSTATNYYTRSCRPNGATTVANAIANASVWIKALEGAGAVEPHVFVGYLMFTAAGVPIFFNKHTIGEALSSQNWMETCVNHAAVASITQIDLVASTGNIAAGSKFTIYEAVYATV